MADSTSVLIKHSLNVNDIDEFKSALERILDITIHHTTLINNIEDDVSYPETYAGWSLTVHDYPYETNIWLDENNERGREIRFGKYYAYIEGFCLDYISQWFMISHCLDKSYPDDEPNFLRERTEIYKLATRFGSDECILLNGSRLFSITEDIANGISLPKAIAKYEENNPIKKIQKYGEYSNIDNYIYSRSQIQVLLLHEIDHSNKYVDSEDWYDTILIDKFRDLEI